MNVGSNFRLLAFALLTVTFPSAIGAQISGGGQTKANESGWTVDTLKQHYEALGVKDEQILALHKQISELRDDHARDLREAADKRYDQRFQAQEAATTKASANQNEFRGSLNDLSNTKIAGSEFKLAIEAMRQQIGDGTKTTDAKLADIQHRLDIKEGTSQGVGNTWTTIFSVVAAGAALIGVIYVIGSRKNNKPPWLDDLVSQLRPPTHPSK